jgi:hypothetical protein
MLQQQLLQLKYGKLASVDVQVLIFYAVCSDFGSYCVLANL